jgi:hypothetical protein
LSVEPATPSLSLFVTKTKVAKPALPFAEGGLARPVPTIKKADRATANRELVALPTPESCITGFGSDEFRALIERFSRTGSEIAECGPMAHKLSELYATRAALV